ncbi:MAG: response regulator [Desulfobacteraceae bacterium]|nr:MAG: response regulator [Desulfobacteraceae bacterium]
MKTILVIDNHRMMLQFMSKVLSEDGYRVLTAGDGLTALKILETHVPDFIFCDLIMPNIAGDKLCRIIRSMPRMKDVFIVIVSAIAAEQQQDVTAFGANACIAKCPFDKMPHHILSVIKQLEESSPEELAGKIIGIENVHCRQITKELLSKKRHSELILDNIAEGIFELSLDGRIIYVNPTAVQMGGGSEEKLLSSIFADHFEDFHRERVKRVLEKMDLSPATISEENPVLFNGRQTTLHLFPVKDEGNDTIVVIARDIAEQARLRSQLQRAEKMEAIGALAGGVAHDLNNILSGLVSYPELLLMEVAEDSPLRKPIQTIQKSGEKAVAIVQDLLTLARRGVPVTEVVNINRIAEDYLCSPEFEELIEYHPKVIVETDLDPNLLNVSGSSVHISKTIMNLVSNASEAMPEGGRVTVKTENRHLDRSIEAYENIAEGDYAVLTVVDTGFGISRENLEKIFEPFYTKKVMGRSGTGLGMTVVYGTVKDHNGYIDIESKEGKGTRLTIYFPATRETGSQDKALLKIEDYMGHGESILVVDDAEDQRYIAEGILGKLGYAAHTVSSGEEAVDFLSKQSVDLVILDMIMDPGWSGLQTYREMIKHRPHQPAIITSGFSETEDVKEAQRLGAGRYIKKPYTIENIGMAVKGALEK